jgi:non-specific serine/threonine protein kinase
MLIGVGVLLGFRGDTAVARQLMEECLAIYRALDDPWGTAWALVDLGQILRHGGERAEAQALTEEALVHVRRSEDIWLLIQTLTALGGLVLEEGETERAASLAAEGLELLRDSGVRWCLPEALELAAGVATTRGRAAVAARLFGASEAVREQTSAVRFIGESAYGGLVRAAGVRMEERSFRAAWAEGRRLSQDQAIEEALGEVQPALLASVKANPLEMLTRREREVAALVARGLTNRQIAEQLVVTEGTAAIHVGHILNKLGFSSRAQVAAWATSHGLVQGW